MEQARSLFCTCDSGVARWQSQTQSHFWWMNSMIEANCTDIICYLWEASLATGLSWGYKHVAKILQFIKHVKGLLWKCKYKVIVEIRERSSHTCNPETEEMVLEQTCNTWCNSNTNIYSGNIRKTKHFKKQTLIWFIDISYNRLSFQNKWFIGIT